MKKVAICNFDELIGEEEAISISTMLKLEKLKKDKYKLIVYSSKSIEDLLYYNRDFPFIDYIVHEKGYYLYDVNKKKKKIDKKINKQLISKLNKIYSPNIELRMDQDSVYEIVIKKYNHEFDKELFIRKEKNNVVVSIEELSCLNIIKEFCTTNNIEIDNIIQITRKKGISNLIRKISLKNI